MAEYFFMVSRMHTKVYKVTAKIIHHSNIVGARLVVYAKIFRIKRVIVLNF